MLKEVHRAGNTIVLITHDPNVANQAARVLHIQDGRITDDRRNDGEVTGR